MLSFLCPEYVNLQRFYDAPHMSIYRDFMVPRVCQFTEILQRFYGAPSFSDSQRFYGFQSMSIYRDFVEILWCSEFFRFTEILWCLEYVNLQRFYDALRSWKNSHQIFVITRANACHTYFVSYQAAVF